MKYIWLALPLVLGQAACSKVDDGSPNGIADADQANVAHTDLPPTIALSVAPGVAFEFRYGFSLPENRIAIMQEQHAVLCGRLGPLHCRITGLTFDKMRSGSLNAAMTFKLDPTLAMGFAREATALVEQADGKLATSQVEGVDAGKSIVAEDQSAERLSAELMKIDAQLGIPDISRHTRDRLLRDGSALRQQLRELTGRRQVMVESLATTPVAFNYEVAAAIATPADALKQGLSAGSSSASALLALLSLALGAVGPWALVLGGAWWLARRSRRRTDAPTADAPMP